MQNNTSTKDIKKEYEEYAKFCEEEDKEENNDIISFDN